MLTMGLRCVYERGWLDRPEIATCRRASRWLLFSTCVGTPPLVLEETGSEHSFLQSDHEVAREAGASPDPNPTNQTRRTQRPPRSARAHNTDTEAREWEKHKNPGPTTPPSHSIEPAIETTLYA